MSRTEIKHFNIAIAATLVLAVAAGFLEPTGWLAIAIGAAAVSALMMQTSVRNILAVAYRKKLYDLPGGRRIHTTPTPRLGGVAFAPIICCVVILALGLHPLIAPTAAASVSGVVPGSYLTLIAAMIIILLAGTVDDLTGVKYPIKLGAQIIAASLVVASGLWVDNLYGLFWIWQIPAAVGMPLTVLFVIGIINALNLIDGMDGLAAGVCMITLAIYGMNLMATDRYFLAVVAASALGALIPFFYSNARGLGTRRHKLFMGDCGSQTMGLLVGVLAIGQMQAAGSGTVLAREDFILALSPLLVPVFDVAHVVFFRLVRGANPFHPDTTHIHHRLLGWGFSPRQAVILILCLTALYVSVGMLLAGRSGVTLIIALDAALWCAVNAGIWALARLRPETIKKRKQIYLKNYEHNL